MPSIYARCARRWPRSAVDRDRSLDGWAGAAGRKSKQDYFAVATQILSEHDHEKLTIQSLCDAFSVSKGSFYQYFNGFPGLVEDFLADWEQEATININATAKCIQSTGLRQRTLSDLILKLPHDAEAAIWVWVRTDPVVRAAHERVDEQRICIIVDAFSERLDAATAGHLAELFVDVMVGEQMRQRPVSAQRVRGAIRRLAELTAAKHGIGLFRD